MTNHDLLEVPPHVRGLIFDCDGTLADTMPLHWQAWQRIQARHGFVFSEAQFYALAGIPSRDILRELAVDQNLDLDPLHAKRKLSIWACWNTSVPSNWW
jgi:beta-phosphoglucomutase-like phosphatase (HAD superfamily)